MSEKVLRSKELSQSICRQFLFMECQQVIWFKVEMEVSPNQIVRIKGYEFSINQILGKGATGSVYKGIRSKDRTQVAIKAILMSEINNQVTQYLLQGEKKAMATIKSNYIVKSQEVIQQKDYCYIVMEICRGGTLKDYIQQQGPLSENQAIQMFRKIVTGYTSIIDNQIIHRDLKTSNIMLRENKDPVIIDFGYCQMIMGKRPLIHYNVGSPSYMSPEAYAKSLYSEKSDVWALGIILYELLTGKTLDFGKKIGEYFDQLKSLKHITFHQFQFTQLTKTLLQKSLTIAPEERASSHKLKYIIDKAMIGKQTPPPTLLNSMKSISFKKTNSNKFEQSEIPQLRLKATYSTIEKVQNRLDIKFKNEVPTKAQHALDNSSIYPHESTIPVIRTCENVQFRYSSNKNQIQQKPIHFSTKSMLNSSAHELIVSDRNIHRRMM